MIVWGASIFAFPLLALADLSENTILQTNMSINLDTGAVAGSGGDLLWNGSTLVLQGAALATKPGFLGETNYDGLPQSYWVSVSAGAKATPIAGNLLLPGNGFVATSNSGKVAKVLILGDSSGVLSLKFTTFGATAPAGVPNLTGVLNNSSGIPFGYPNYGIAPSSLFVVTGSGLADPGAPVLQSSQGSGIPLSLNGCSITVVVSGTTVHPGLYYTSPTQVAAVLPASTPLGIGTLTVTYRGITSAPITLVVVTAAVGFNTFSQLGTYNSNVNIGVATDSITGALITFTNSAAVGEYLTLWSTGLGSDPDDSDTVYTGAPHTLNTPLQLYFGGELMDVLYAGASTYPGVNEIVFKLPPDVLTGCYVPLEAVTGNVISNVVNIPVHAGGGTCFEVITGVSGDQILAKTQNVIRGGVVEIIQSSTTSTKGVVTVSSSASTAFEKYGGLVPAATGLIVSQGGCTVGPAGMAGNPISVQGLDPGTITLTGPAGLFLPLPQQLVAGEFGAVLPAGIPPTGGTYTFTGTGGADVGSFTAALTLTNPVFNWTNPSAAAAISKAAGFSVSWTGGNPGSAVLIGGTSPNLLGAGTAFSCRMPAELGTFTVPPYVLLGMPGGAGAVNVQNDMFGTMTAAGLDDGGKQTTISFSVPATFQ
jgi:uncharacterized protein (TIGR03437 family)